MVTRQRKMKKILDITKLSWNEVEVEYFDGQLNSPNYAKRRVYFPDADKSGNDAYIMWFGEKKIVESLYL